MPPKLTFWRSGPVRYGAALVAVGAGLGCHLALEDWVGQDLSPFITFYPVVMFVALLAGLGPGLVTALVAALAVDYWLIHPVGGFRIKSPGDAANLALFTGINLLMCLVAEVLRRVRLKAAAFDREQALRETRRQNEFLANVLERASQPFAVGYPDGRLGQFNRAFEELTGYTAAELRTMDWASAMTPPEWRELERQKLEELHVSGQPVRYEKEYLRKDGTRVPIELLVHLARDAEGRPEYYYAFATDISERKRSEATLRDLNAQLQQRVAELQAANQQVQASRRAAINLVDDAVQARKQAETASAELRSTLEQRRLALEAADLGMWDYHFQTGDVFWDERCRQMWGMALLVHVDYAAAISRIHPEDRAGLDIAVKEALAGRDGGAYHREFRVVWPDGSVHWITSHGHVYFQGEGAERRAVRFIGANLEITAEKQAQQALRESEERLAAFAAATFEGIVLSERGRIVDCNEQFAQMAGCTVEELKGRSIAEFVAPEDRERVVENIRTGQESVIEHQMLRRDGSRIIVEAHGRPRHLSRHGLRHSALRDITERKQREELLEKLNRTLKALKDSSQAMTRATSEAQYLDEVCKIVVEDCGHAMVWIGLAADDQAKSVQPVAYAGFEEGYLETLRITWADTERGQGPTGTAIRTGKPCICANVLSDPRIAPWRAEALKRGYASSLVVPLLAEGRAFGALTIYARQPDPFSEDEVTLLVQLAEDVSYCVSALRLRADRARAEGRSELLAETASQLLSTDSPQEVVEDLCRKVLGFLDCQAFFNYLVDEPTGRLHLNACAGVPAEEACKAEWLDYGSAVCGCAARDRSRIVAENIPATPDPRTDLVKSYGILAYACHPLMIEGRVLGTLSFGTRTRRQFREEELSLMKAVADLVSIALERQRTRAALQQAKQELEQRVAERTTELRATSLYARSLIEASLDPLVTISPEGKITDVNRATEEVTGVSRERLVGASFSGYFTEPAKAEAGYQQVLAEGLVRDYPLTIRHASGRTTDVLYHATVYRDEAGQVQGVFAAARDITERKQAERRRDFTTALLALFAQKTSARDYLHSVLEVVRQWSGCQALGIRITDEHGEIPYESWAGFEPEFVRLENRLSLQRDNCCCIRAISQDFEKQDRALLTPGGSYRCDDAIAFVNGLPPEQRARYRGNCMKFGFASLAIIPIRYREKVVGAVHLADRRPGQFPLAVVEFLEGMTPLVGEAMQRFQTEAELARHRDQLEVLVQQRTQELTTANARLQHTAEDLSRSNRDLEQFAYVASHDLQEPLRAVGGYVRLLERRLSGALDAKTRGYVNGALEGALRMERLIHDLLAYSRVGTRGGSFVPANLGAVLDQALRNLQAGIESAHATISHDPMPTLCADATQLMQLFQNLIGNALKFHAEAPPKIHIGARRQERRWEFSVRDNGIGIEPQYYGKLFQVFQRLHTRKDYPGTGIGLAICKRIVERHGGTIWIESRPGQGATFYFSIPDPENAGQAQNA